MREIKFRGKRIDNGEWVYGYFVKTPKGECRICWQPFAEATSNTWHQVIPETVGQFTGLKDANGKEIYKGDILGAYDTKGEQVRHTVVFDTEKASFAIVYHGSIPAITGPSSFSQTWLNQFQNTIIGNIHENKNLLT